MKIEHLIIIHGAILIVYYTSHQGYQYEIAVNEKIGDSLIYQPNEIYKTANQAKEVAVERIKIVLGYQ